MKTPQSVQTAAALANGAELVFNIAQGVLGNEVADTVNGQPLTRQAIYDTAQTQFQAVASNLLKTS
jgi:hypothetical protein